MNTNNTTTYPQIQAINPTIGYKKHVKGIKTGKILLFTGVAIAAGLSNVLSVNSIITPYSFGMYGVIVGTGSVIAVSGIATMIINGIKLQIKDNPNLIENTDSPFDHGDKFHNLIANDGTVSSAGTYIPLH